MPDDKEDALDTAYSDYLDACIDKGEEPMLLAEFTVRWNALKNVTTLPAPTDDDDDLPY